MNTFTSCGLPWYPWPSDHNRPCHPGQYVRVLTLDELDGIEPYNQNYIKSSCSIPWGYPNAGWYPVNPDGSEIKKPDSTRVIRRRFKLKTR
jgi:hypothetical protein